MNMNIDNSKLRPLFPSGESLDALPQTLQSDGAFPQGFADTLMETIRPFEGLDEVIPLPEGVASDALPEQITAMSVSNELDKLQDFADFWGQGLPPAEQTVVNGIDNVTLTGSDLNNVKAGTADAEDMNAEGIDLENTLGALASVMNTLKSFDSGKNDSLAQEDVSKAPEIPGLFQPPLKKEGSVKTEGAAFAELAQQDNRAVKQTLDAEKTIVNTAKTIEMPELKEAEVGQTKDVAKFTTEMANLNRAVMPNNKVDVPAMTKHFAHPEWNKEVGERVVWMYKQAIPSAELRLNPQHLGPVTVKVDVNQDQVNVAFTTQHAAVKEALEAAVPKLREMLSSQQLNLLDVNVTQDDSRQRQSQGFNQMGSGSGERERNESADKEPNKSAEKTLNIADEIEAGRAIASNGVLSLFA